MKNFNVADSLERAPPHVGLIVMDHRSFTHGVSRKRDATKQLRPATQFTVAGRNDLYLDLLTGLSVDKID